MSSIASIRASNAAVTHRTKPVAVFVGGTSGIGEAMARAFGRHTKGNADIIIVGRNQEAADEIFASIPKPESTAVSREFVQCDVSLMKNVNSATESILAKHPKINYLVVTTGIMTLNGRDETEEGIDKKLAVHYYARWKFLNNLLPSIKKAKEEDDTGAVMSVMSAGHGGKVNLDDLGLKKTFSVRNAALIAPTYNDLMMESYSQRYPTLSLIHAFPGGVPTNLTTRSPSALVRASSFLMFAFRPFLTSPEDCGDYLWHSIYNTAKAPGAWRVDSSGSDIGKKNYFGDDEQRTKLWEHTSEEVASALGK